ncbi:hypothetical protein DFJ74DRAFT_643406 [Hyaloraphidium curvatum]|nr:hypothetical protein DFJ74DRAFT_643406 [Hyaloraphidium curvatum]
MPPAAAAALAVLLAAALSGVTATATAPALPGNATAAALVAPNTHSSGLFHDCYTYRDCGTGLTCCDGWESWATATTAEACQSGCTVSSSCSFFSWDPATRNCRFYGEDCTRSTRSAPGVIFRTSLAACPAVGCPAPPPPPPGARPFVACPSGRTCCGHPLKIVHTADLRRCEYACRAEGLFCNTVNFNPATGECRVQGNACEYSSFASPGIISSARTAANCPPAQRGSPCVPWVGLPPAEKRTTARKRTTTAKRT